MRTIQVSTQTFSMIWSKRKEGEESEDEILERLLTEETEPSRTTRWKTNEAPPMMPNLPKKLQTTEDLRPGAEYSGWLGIVVRAFETLGQGPHHLSDIYQAVEELLPPEKLDVQKREESVRGTIYDNCPTSKRFKHIHSVFRTTGRGYWELMN